MHFDPMTDLGSGIADGMRVLDADRGGNDVAFQDESRMPAPGRTWGLPRSVVETLRFSEVSSLATGRNADMNAATPPPRFVYIIRHGEKPPDPPPDAVQPPTPAPPFGVDFEGNQNPHSLIPRGWQRSGALTVLFDPTLGPPEAGLKTPGALFSPSYGDPTKTIQHRTYQTIQGLAGRLGLQISSPFQEGQESDLAANVVGHSSGVVLICWEHDHIPALATGFPVVADTKIPSIWPGNRFDVIWTFALVQEAAPVQYLFGQVPQQLLLGDAPTVIPTD